MHGTQADNRLRPIDAELKRLYEERANSIPVLTSRSPDPDPSWHFVQIVGGRERAIADRLKEYKFGVYYPQLMVMKPVPRKQLSAKQRKSGSVVSRPRLEPFLPGYMLVEFNLERDPWHDIFKFVGVRGMVAYGNKPKPVPKQMVDNWIVSEVNGAIPGATKLAQLFGTFNGFPYKIGENVRINQGPFASFSATVEILPHGIDADLPIQELDESMRVTLVVHLFGRETPVQLPISHLDKV